MISTALGPFWLVKEGQEDIVTTENSVGAVKRLIVKCCRYMVHIIQVCPKRYFRILVCL